MPRDYPLNKKHATVFYGWYIVGACLFIGVYVSGIVYFGFTAVFEPIAEEFGWSYAQISLAASLRGLEIGLLAPVVGLLVDRWGPRRLLFTSSILLFIGFLFLSRVSSLAMFYGAFALIATGISACSVTVTMTAVGNWFRRKVGMATGIVSTGIGLGGFLVPVVTGLVDSLQWRNAMLVLSLGMPIIIMPLSLVVRHRPEPYGYRPDGDDGEMQTTQSSEMSTFKAETSISVSQVSKNRTFWTIAVPSTFFMLGFSAFQTHVMPYFSTLGIARSTSSLIALALPVLSILGRLGSGWLSDKLGRRQIFAASFALISAGLLLFEYVTPAAMLLVIPAIITYSLGWGSFTTARIALLREHFGRGSLGAILGFTSGIMMVGMVAGAPLAGWVFDTWGSYQGVWLGYGILVFMGMLCVMTIPSPKNKQRLIDRSTIKS